jgi:hypothetical protein
VAGLRTDLTDSGSNGFCYWLWNGTLPCVVSDHLGRLPRSGALLSQVMFTDRTNGGLIRTTIAAQTDPASKARYQMRYNWLKNHWFGGVEFYRDATVLEGRRDTVGLQCLRDQCAGIIGK